MIAERYIGDAEYKRFYRNYYNAFLSQSNKKEKLDSLYESLEKEFILIGATAIEDCLQDDLSIFIIEKLNHFHFKNRTNIRSIQRNRYKNMDAYWRSSFYCSFYCSFMRLNRGV
jgi:RNAse (barnase) inhibitor barstar